MWPIRDLGGDVIGFGARKLFDDDDGPKYLNTPETPIYKKSQVLYGIDLARRDISKNQQAVIVEGYTDVMACHLAGITTAVATCGTSFGTEHIKVLRRLLMDDDQMRGSVVFTFDGDAAGQKAALRAFEEDQRFVTQTFVAVEPTGLDPCDLRLQHGDAAVVALVDRRVPLFEFAIRSTLAAYDLETAEGRIAALREAAPIVAKIRDTALRPEYARRLAGWLGARRRDGRAGGAVRGPGRQAPTPSRRDAFAEHARAPRSRRTAGMPRAADRRPARPGARRRARGAQVRAAAARGRRRLVRERRGDRLHPSDRPAGALRHRRRRLAAARSCPVCRGSTPSSRRPTTTRSARLVRELAVEPLPAEAGQDARYAIGVISRLLELDASRRIDELKGRLQRIDPVAQAAEYQQCFADLLALEDYRRSLGQDALGGESA